MTELIGGRRPVTEALASGRAADRLLVAETARKSPELDAILDHARRRSVRVERIPRDRLERLAGFEGHQGVLLEVAHRRYSDVTEMLAHAARAARPPFLLVLDSLEDPVNFGSLLRAGEAAGVDGVIFPARRAAPLSAAAVKASAGASEHLLLARVESLGETLRELKERGVFVIAADEKAEVGAWESDLTGPIAVVVGSEGSGISGATRRRCDLLVRFPMAGHVASLNAATAGALLLFEVVRQRSTGAAAR